MDSKIWLFSRFTTITAHFHPGSSAHAENKPFFSEDAFQSFGCLLLEVGIEVDGPPLPRLGVEQFIAALR
jgi:hypothetical protein